MLLVVPDNDYNTKVAVVIGTNVLPSLVRSMTDHKLGAGIWKTVHACIQSSEHIPVKCSMSSTIPPGDKVIINGSIHISSLPSSNLISMRQMIVEHVCEMK